MMIPYKKTTLLLGLIFGLLLIKTSPVGTAQQVTQVDTLRASSIAPVKPETPIAPKTVAYYASQLNTLPISLRPGTEHRTDSKSTKSSEERCKSIVYRTLEVLPQKHREKLKELTLFYTPDGRRGLGGNGSIVLRCMNVTNSELAAVLTHEMGHIVDSDVLIGTSGSQKSGFYDFETPVTADDLSAQFYQICWTSETKRKSTTTTLDFVSEYAMSDPFEDFAETYAYYRLHGSEFQSVMTTSELLRKKYAFMRDIVFNGHEYTVGEAEPVQNIYHRNYDVTVLPFKLNNLLG